MHAVEGVVERQPGQHEGLRRPLEVGREPVVEQGLVARRRREGLELGAVQRDRPDLGLKDVFGERKDAEARPGRVGRVAPVPQPDRVLP